MAATTSIEGLLFSAHVDRDQKIGHLGLVVDAAPEENSDPATDGRRDRSLRCTPEFTREIARYLGKRVRLTTSYELVEQSNEAKP